MLTDTKFAATFSTPLDLNVAVMREYLTNFLPSVTRIVYITAYTIKQFIGGWLTSPTEWVELALFWGGRAFSGGFIDLSFKSKAVTHLWNWGDNLLFMFFEDENTYGLYKFFAWGELRQEGPLY